MGIRNILCVDNYYKIRESKNSVLPREVRIYVLCVFLIEHISCKVCVLVRSSGLIFGQVRLWHEYGVLLCVVYVLPLVTGCTVE